MDYYTEVSKEYKLHIKMGTIPVLYIERFFLENTKEHNLLRFLIQ